MAGALSRCKNLIPHTCLGAYSTRSTIMTVTFSRYILVWERTLEQSSHTTEWARTLRFGAGLLVPLQGAAAGCCSAAVRVLCGLWSWVALQLQGCRCRVPLQGAAECCLRFGAWLLVRCSRCLCCCSGKLRQVLSRVQSFFSFSLFVFRTRRALVGWYAFQPRWPRFGLVLAASFLAYATVAVVLRAA